MCHNARTLSLYEKNLRKQLAKFFNKESQKKKILRETIIEKKNLKKQLANVNLIFRLIFLKNKKSIKKKYLSPTCV